MISFSQTMDENVLLDCQAEFYWRLPVVHVLKKHHFLHCIQFLDMDFKIT